MNYKSIANRARIPSSTFLGIRRKSLTNDFFSISTTFMPSDTWNLSPFLRTGSTPYSAKILGSIPLVKNFAFCTAIANSVQHGTSDLVLSDPTEDSKAVQELDLNKKDTNPLWDQKRPTYPFTAIVGQEEMKLALLLNVIDPKIGGVMIMGDRGTGKSTTVRALVDLLPTIEVVDNDPFNSHPSDAELMSQNVREQVLKGKLLNIVSKKTTMIDLPLGATEDRVCGTIDIERALSEGVKAFEPGLLAKANRGILYVDEVNLLDDHLVDILLDSAASGWNTVEREGISISHPARFILVGSGNPEEGELRPQLLDRFGMHAQIGTVREAELRVKIVEERASFDRSPLEFLSLHKENQQHLADKIVAARHLLGAVKIDYDLRVKISHICSQLNVDGLRGDIVTNRASQALPLSKLVPV